MSKQRLTQQNAEETSFDVYQSSKLAPFRIEMAFKNMN